MVILRPLGHSAGVVVNNSRRVGCWCLVSTWDMRGTAAGAVSGATSIVAAQDQQGDPNGDRLNRRLAVGSNQHLPLAAEVAPD